MTVESVKAGFRQRRCRRARIALTLTERRLLAEWICGQLSKTIYELLAENNVGSRIYYHDSTMAMTFKGLMNQPLSRNRLHLKGYN